jgi:hypothetical protein
MGDIAMKPYGMIIDIDRCKGCYISRPEMEIAARERFLLCAK